MDDVLTKRIHISGLTPQISASDLTHRFSSFGNVKSLDGFGMVDANGFPRPYAYMTLECTKGQLSKCLNLLSGTMWKGAKLRLGEAKPDFRERIQKEQEDMKRAAEDGSTRSRKRKRIARGCHGVHSADMAPVTLFNFSKRSLWHRTPLGRLIRPMRMRPARPLPPPVESGDAKLTMALKRLKKKRKGQLVRARRILIDPEVWGSEYMKGIILEGGSRAILLEKPFERKMQSEENEEAMNVGSLEETEAREMMSVEEDAGDTGHDREEAESVDFSDTRSGQASPSPLPQSHATLASAEIAETDLAREARQSLALLTSIFGNASSDDDWGDAENLSDVDMEAAVATKATQSIARTSKAEDEDPDIEFVPRSTTITSSLMGEGKIVPMEVAREEEYTPELHTAPAKVVEEKDPRQAVQMTVLKDMFAPRAEDVGFSILGNLDIDLELDDALDTPSIPAPASGQVAASSALPALLDALPTAQSYSQAVLDANRPLFFPVTLSSGADDRLHTGWRSKAPLDFIILAHERGWAEGFHRTDSAEDIKKRWENCKVDLTREWKRRHREAVKSARRRGGLGAQD